MTIIVNKMDTNEYDITRPKRYYNHQMSNSDEVLQETIEKIKRCYVEVTSIMHEISMIGYKRSIKYEDCEPLNKKLHEKCKKLLKLFDGSSVYWDSTLIDFVMTYPKKYIRYENDSYETYKSRIQKYSMKKIMVSMENFETRQSMIKTSEILKMKPPSLEEKMYDIGYKLKKCDNDIEDMCAICLNNFKKEENIIITKCNSEKQGTMSKHTFHSECLTKWFESLKNTKHKHTFCPLCKSKSIELV